jgi:hypothetical protein
VIGREPVIFAGWALAGSTAPTGVDVVLDRGRRRFEAVVGGDRPDVPQNLGEPGATTACGWMAPVDLSTEAAGDLRVQVVVTDEPNRSEVVAECLFVVFGDSIAGAIDAPTNGSLIKGDLLVVHGWASSADGLASIDIQQDGIVLGQACLGIPRVHEREHERDRYGPICGFEFRGRTRPRENLVPRRDLRVGHPSNRRRARGLH